MESLPPDSPLPSFYVGYVLMKSVFENLWKICTDSIKKPSNFLRKMAEETNVVQETAAEAPVQHFKKSNKKARYAMMMSYQGKNYFGMQVRDYCLRVIYLDPKNGANY